MAYEDAFSTIWNEIVKQYQFQPLISQKYTVEKDQYQRCPRLVLLRHIYGPLHKYCRLRHTVTSSHVDAMNPHLALKEEREATLNRK